LVDVGLSSVAGIDEFEALLLRLRLSGSRGARHFADTFSGWAGGSTPFPFGGTRSFGNFRVGRDLWVGVACVRDSEESSEIVFLEGLELSYPANT
jgi:hypothetical protein